MRYILRMVPYWVIFKGNTVGVIMNPEDYLYASLAINALLLMFLIRHQAIYMVLWDFDDEGQDIEDLPQMNDMLYNPVYWLIWSTDSWMAWVKRNPIDDGDES